LQNIGSFIGLFCKKKPKILSSVLTEATAYDDLDSSDLSGADTVRESGKTSESDDDIGFEVGASVYY